MNSARQGIRGAPDSIVEYGPMWVVFITLGTPTFLNLKENLFLAFCFNDHSRMF